MKIAWRRCEGWCWMLFLMSFGLILAETSSGDSIIERSKQPCLRATLMAALTVIRRRNARAWGSSASHRTLWGDVSGCLPLEERENRILLLVYAQLTSFQVSDVIKMFYLALWRDCRHWIWLLTSLFLPNSNLCLSSFKWHNYALSSHLVPPQMTLSSLS